jgi:hypothetical protein
LSPATVIVDHVVVQVISASRSEWIVPFTGLEPGQFRKLVRLVAQRGGEEIADGRHGRQWRLDLADRVLLVAAYWRTNLTMRQIGPLFGVSHSAAHRVIDTIGPLLALAPVRKRRVDSVAIVDGTLVPTRDHRLAAPSKNYRYSANVRRNAGGSAGDGYQGNPDVIMPFRKPCDGSDLPDWKEELNAAYRTVRARVEHVLARMKCWKILRDYRRAASTLGDTVSGIAHLHNILLIG